MSVESVDEYVSTLNEDGKRKTKNIVLGMIAVMIAAVAGLVIYKSQCMQ